MPANRERVPLTWGKQVNKSNNESDTGPKRTGAGAAPLVRRRALLLSAAGLPLGDALDADAVRQEEAILVDGWLVWPSDIKRGLG